MSSEKRYNSLPGDFEGNEQQRRTNFSSAKEKLMYDAQGLIGLARQTYGKEGVTVAEAVDLRSRNNPESGTDSDVEDLRRAIAIQLKTKPDFEAWLDKLVLPEADLEKLRVALSPEEYRLSVAAYRETGGIKQPPTLDQIRAEIMTWPEECLRKECEMREKPILTITESSFDEGIKAMDRNKHYKNTKGELQRNATVHLGDRNSSYYIGTSKPKKGRVTLTDGVVHPRQLTDVSTELGQRRDYLTQQYEKAGMSHIGGTDMQALIQRSLIEALEQQDNSLIVDNWEGENRTATFINPKTLRESAYIAYVYFHPADRCAFFFEYNPDGKAAYLRGRASKQIMEF